VSLLNEIEKVKKILPRRIMIYGTHGIGKSTFGAMAPAPIFIQTEEGLGDIECHKFPLSETYEDVQNKLSALYAETHEYKTLVIDSADWLETLIWAEVCRRGSQENIEEFGYGKGYMLAVDLWREFLEGLNALRSQRGMTVILVAHAKVENFKSPDSEPYDRYSPRLDKRASPVLQEWCDEVMFASYKVFTKQIDGGFNKKITQGIGTGERVLRTTERPSHLAKNRLNLPEEIPLNWEAYSQHLPQNQTEKTGETV